VVLFPGLSRKLSIYTAVFEIQDTKKPVYRYIANSTAMKDDMISRYASLLMQHEDVDSIIAMFIDEVMQGGGEQEEFRMNAPSARPLRRREEAFFMTRRG
jgi:hypothetical protein